MYGVLVTRSKYSSPFPIKVKTMPWKNHNQNSFSSFSGQDRTTQHKRHIPVQWQGCILGLFQGFSRWCHHVMSILYSHSSSPSHNTCQGTGDPKYSQRVWCDVSGLDSPMAMQRPSEVWVQCWPVSSLFPHLRPHHHSWKVDKIIECFPLSNDCFYWIE